MTTDCSIDKRVESYVKRHGLKAVKGRRIYEEQGMMGTLRYWIDGLQDVFGNDLIPYQWVADFVMVSRVALMKRVNKGQLTVFSFQILETEESLFGRTKLKPSRNDYKYVPKEECNAWILNSISDRHLIDQGDFDELRPKHVSGWWDEIQ